MWKALFDVIRNKVDIDVDLDIDEGKVTVRVTLKFGNVTLFTDEFEWAVPRTGDGRRKLRSPLARRKRVLPQAA